MTTKLTVGAENSLINGLLIDINEYPIHGPNDTKYRVMTADDIEAIEENNFEEDKISCFDNIRNGSKSLKKTIEIFSSSIPKLNEERIEDLKECSFYVDNLIKAKEGYYASKGLLGKIFALLSRTFGSIKDAANLKSKLNSIQEAQENEIANSYCSKLNTLHKNIRHKQYSPETKHSDIEKLMNEFEETYISLTTLNIQTHDKYKMFVENYTRILDTIF